MNDAREHPSGFGGGEWKSQADPVWQRVFDLWQDRSKQEGRKRREGGHAPMLTLKLARVARKPSNIPRERTASYGFLTSVAV